MDKEIARRSVEIDVPTLEYHGVYVMKLYLYDRYLLKNIY